MGIVTGSGYTLSDDSPLTSDHPLIGWRNVVTTTNIVADTAAAGYPATNLANPATHSYARWRASTTALQYLTITPTAAHVDYVGIAQHNLFTAGISVSVEGNTGSGYSALTTPAIPSDNKPLLFRFTPNTFTGLRVKLAAGSAVAEIAVVYAGKLLIMPRKLFQGFTPPSAGLAGKEVNAMSEDGDYLGSIITQRHNEAKVPFSLVTPTYRRASIDPFFAARVPFFFGWRPATYPAELGYMRLTNWPQPAPQSPHSLESFSLEMTGLA